AGGGKRVLVVSTDPAHSLGDVLGRRLGATPRSVRARVDAVELDAPRALERWLRPRRAALEEILSRGLYLGDADLRRRLRHTFPGIDELVALLELSRLARGGEWDEVVVDTAPIGHTRRLLEMPATLLGVGAVLERMQAKHHEIVAALSRRS